MVYIIRLISKTHQSYWLYRKSFIRNARHTEYTRAIFTGYIFKSILQSLSWNITGNYLNSYQSLMKNYKYCCLDSDCLVKQAANLSSEGKHQSKDKFVHWNLAGVNTNRNMLCTKIILRASCYYVRFVWNNLKMHKSFNDWYCFIFTPNSISAVKIIYTKIKDGCHKL